MASSQEQIFTPELLKVIKIFGVASVLLVLLLSFFNEKRANNTGREISELTVMDANRLYFKNVRTAWYDAENRHDAKMDVFRYGKRITEAEMPLLNLAILINRKEREAYIYVETNFETPFILEWRNLENQSRGSLSFEGGDKFSHWQFVKEFYPILLQTSEFFLLKEGDKKPLLLEDKQREALLTTCADFYKLINQPS
jgi:hypothetical protein